MLFTALLGNPVEHSVSTHLFAEYAKTAGLEYAHLKLNVPTERDLPDYLRSLQRIGCLGVNITLPYKLAVMQHLDEQDARSLAIGAVNTIVFSDDQRLLGYNTDGMGAYRAIATYLRPPTPTDHITVLGAGGAARAIIYELYQRTDQITVFGRIQAELDKLADDFDQPQKQRLKTSILAEEQLFASLKITDFLINTTPVGMYPQAHQSLIPSQMISLLAQERDMRSLFAFDAVFNPHTTQMLQIVAQQGGHICSGLWMMIYQAVEAFQLWTGKDVSHIPFDQIELKLRKLLESKYQNA